MKLLPKLGVVVPRRLRLGDLGPELSPGRPS